jgi:hypothetical protein
LKLLLLELFGPMSAAAAGSGSTPTGTLPPLTNAPRPGASPDVGIGSHSSPSSLTTIFSSTFFHSTMIVSFSFLPTKQGELGETKEPLGRPAASSNGGGKPKLPQDRVAVLAIAYHNLAVQQEFLK